MLIKYKFMLHNCNTHRNNYNAHKNKCCNCDCNFKSFRVHRIHHRFSKAWAKYNCIEKSHTNGNIYMSFFFRKKCSIYQSCNAETKTQSPRDMILNQETLACVLSLSSLILASLSQSSRKLFSGIVPKI